MKLYRIRPYINPSRGPFADDETFLVPAEDAASALAYAFEHSEGIAIPDNRDGWEVVAIPGVFLGAEEE